MPLLTAKLDLAFARILSDKRVRRVDIATAWATEGPALDSLEEAGKQRNVKVRALVGVAGGHTSPTALKRLCKLGQVRLVDGGNGLFHVKLYLFRRRSTSVAWIGSANFTHPGFEKNEEILPRDDRYGGPRRLVREPLGRSRRHTVAQTVAGVLQDMETARHPFAR